jgi:hypothetical protein
MAASTAPPPAPPVLVVSAEIDGTPQILTGDPASHGLSATVTMRPIPGPAPLPGIPADTAGPIVRYRVTCDISCSAADPLDARIVISAPLAGAEVPFWMIPGLFYGLNRPDGCGRVFPSFRPDGADPAGLVSDHWEFRADRSAVPAVFAWTGRAGLAMAAAETTELGMTGIGFRYAAGGSQVWLSFPYAERPVSYRGRPYGEAPLSQLHRWQPGERRTVLLDVFTFGPDRHSYAPILRSLHAASVLTAPVRPWVGLQRAAELTAYGLHRWHYHPEHGALYETAAFERDIGGEAMGQPDRPEMHVAWVSGIPYARALIRHGRRIGNDDYVAAGQHVIDTICGNLAPCGSFWGRWSLQHGWTQSWTPLRHGLHARTLAEAALFTARAIADEHAAGRSRPQWEVALRGTLALATAGMDADGNPGSMYHALTGEVLSRAGAAGLTWVVALAEASVTLDEPAWLDAARAAGHYYARYVRDETLCGAPEDVDLAPTSEDGVAAILAYSALYRATGEREWLELARHGADWMLTFRYIYNTGFDPHTLLGDYGFATRGADQASPSNQHLHSYGLMCTAELAELSRACGDPHYAERAAETLACLRQFIARADGDFNARLGMASERFYQTECFQPKGMLLTLSHSWCLGVLLLACEDALGQPDLMELEKGYWP